MGYEMKFKVGDLVEYKKSGCLGVIVQDKKFNKLIVQIHPFIFGDIIEKDWELLEKSKNNTEREDNA